MFGKQKAAPPKVYPLHEFVLKLDALVAAGRAGGLDVRSIADLLDGRAVALRMSWVVGAPANSSMHG